MKLVHPVKFKMRKSELNQEDNYFFGIHDSLYRDDLKNDYGFLVEENPRKPGLDDPYFAMRSYMYHEINTPR